jgi:hypothetical protein
VAPNSAFPLGPGPVYPNLGNASAIAGGGGDVIKDGWDFHKTLWAIAPSYRGPVLVRGRALRGAATLRFEHPWNGALRLPALPAGASRRWRYAPTDTLFSRSGCYGYQIDGTGFSTVVVFEAVRAASA